MASASATPQRSLLWGSGSTPAWRVLIALKEKELPFESNLIEFGKGGHKTEEAIKKNPRGQVPTLTDGDVVVCESLAACIYLEETYASQGTPLLPPLSQPAARAQVWQRAVEAENLQKVASTLFRMSFNPSKHDEEATAKAWSDFETEVGRWETILGNTQYIAGPAFTLADVILGPSVLQLKRGSADLGPFPKLSAYADLIAQRPSVESTWPPHWKTSPNGSFFQKK